MKLSGNKKNGRYSSGSRRGETPPADRSGNSNSAGAVGKHKGSHRAAKIIIAILAIILAILVTFYVMLKVGLKPPAVKEEPKPPGSSDAAASGVQAQPPARDKTIHTLVILGMDDGNGNTDTMMVATFDDNSYTLNVVSIPRDTLMNVSWRTKKANSLYANGGMDRVYDGMTALLGYEPDNYIKINLDAFSKLVDGIGGVDFDVPKAMNYEDPVQDLYIHLQAGPQTLDGAHALQLVRARQKVWATGDIGRIEMQQAFLKAAAGQILEKKNSLKIKTLIDIFLNDVDTDLSASDFTWYAREFFKMDAAGISFETIPANYNDTVNGDSYCTVKVNEWLKVLNTKLNPYDYDIKADDLSILTRDDNGKLYVTNGVWAGKKSWGSGSSSGSKPSSSPKPAASPGQGVSPSSGHSAEPSPARSAEPSPDSSPSDTGSVTSPGDTGGTSSPSPDGTPDASLYPGETAGLG